MFSFVAKKSSFGKPQWMKREQVILGCSVIPAISTTQLLHQSSEQAWKKGQKIVKAGSRGSLQ